MKRLKVSEQLRTHTFDAHRALEKTASMRSLMGPEITINEYIDVIVKWWPCWSRLEQQLTDCTLNSWQRELLPEPRAYLLLDDLQVLGAKTVQPTRQPELPDISNGGWLGTAYVMRGAQIGSTLIAAHLLKTLGLSDSGASFFRSHAPKAAAENWYTWRLKIDSISATVDEEHAAIKAAQQTFTFMEFHFA
jgi:heme oxygenase